LDGTSKFPKELSKSLDGMVEEKANDAKVQTLLKAIEQDMAGNAASALEFKTRQFSRKIDVKNKIDGLTGGAVMGHLIFISEKGEAESSAEAEAGVVGEEEEEHKGDGSNHDDDVAAQLGGWQLGLNGSGGGGGQRRSAYDRLASVDRQPSASVERQQLPSQLPSQLSIESLLRDPIVRAPSFVEDLQDYLG
jgi:hypothetical protein